MDINLYALPIDGTPEPTTFCGGACSEGCAAIVEIPGADDAYLLTDTKNADAPGLRFTGAELRDLAEGLPGVLGASA